MGIEDRKMNDSNCGAGRDGALIKRFPRLESEEIFLP